MALIVRIVRTERITSDEDAAATAQQLVDVMSTEFSSTARQANREAVRRVVFIGPNS